MKFKNYLRALNILTILVYLVSTVGLETSQAANLSPAEISIPKTVINASPTPAPDNLRYGYNPNTGKLNFVGGDASSPLLAAGAGQIGAQSVENASAAVLSKYAAGFGLKDPSQELTIERTSTFGSGSTLRYQQQNQGIPVLGGELVINSDTKGNILSLNGKVSPDLTLNSATPAISADQATKLALASMPTWYKALVAGKTSASQPQLWIYDEKIFKPSILPVALVWRMDVQALDGSTPVDELVLVNAQNGQIALHFNQADTFASQQFQEPDATQTATTAGPQESVATDTETVEPPAMAAPTEIPTTDPSSTNTPSQVPSGTSVPSPQPSSQPTETAIPSAVPTQQPTEPSNPTGSPTPEITPSATPTAPALMKAQSAMTWYISTSGNDANDCTTPSTACATFNGTIGKASDGDTIEAASGVYTNTASDVVNIYKSVDLSGGWDAGYSTQSGFSIIDGQNTRRGIFINYGIVTTIQRFIVRNGAPGGPNQTGGAIYAGGNGSLTILQSSIYHSSAWRGGGIYSDGQQKLALINTSIGDNTASNEGGGIFLNNTPELDMSNATITENSNTLNHGGGLALLEPSNSSYTITMQNTILAQNFSVDTSGVATSDDCWSSTGGQSVPVAVQSNGYNLFENTQGCTFNSAGGDITGQDPRFTYHTPDAYPLSLNSPALDAGNPAAPGSGQYACEAVDQLGTTRPLDGNQDGSAVCDIGAIETDPNAAQPTVSLAVSSGTPQSHGIQRPYPVALSVIATDPDGNVLINVPVTFTAPSSGASGTFADTSNNQTVVRTSLGGIASAPIFTANDQAGQFVVTASAAGSASTVQFQLQNYIPVPAKIVVKSGNNQYASPLSAFNTNLAVYVEDNGGHPLGGTTVSFSAPSSGASGTFADSSSYSTSVITDANGIASAPVFTANGIMGTYVVNASVAGLDQTANFTLTNAELYVSPDGVDPNTSNGTECQNPASPCKTLAYAVSKAPAGVSILIKSGVYTNGASMTIHQSTLVISGGWNTDFSAQTGQSVVGGNETWYYASITVSNGTSLDVSRLSLRDYHFVNNGTLTIRNTAILVGFGVGLFNSGSGSLTNTTIAGISIDTSQIVNPYNFNYGIINQGTLSLQFDTISGIPGEGISNNFSSASITTIQTSIIAGNINWDVYFEGGVNTSKGNNIFGDAMYPHISSDRTFSDPKLGKLTNQSYFPLQAGSLAIDAIDPNDPNTACPATDQRGIARPVGPKCDIGAFEYTPPSSPASLFSLSNSPQSAWFNSALPNPFVVEVIDSNGSPDPGVTITFTAPSSGASGTFAGNQSNTTQVLTDVNGIATSPVFTTNSETGLFTVLATVIGVDNVAFQVGNYPPGLYVDAAHGNDASDCHIPNNPCRTINNAIQHSQSGVLIKFASGTYDPSYSSINVQNLPLSGGWDSTFSTQNGRSIFTGATNSSGLYILQGSNVSVDHIDLIANGDNIQNWGTLVFQDGSIENAKSNTNILNYGNLTLSNVTITSTKSYGLDNYGGSASLTNVTIAQNFIYDSFSPVTAGAGIYNQNGTVTIKNTIVALNRSNKGYDCSGTITSLGHNLIGIGDGCGFSPAAGDRVGTADKPLDAGLANFGNNGGTGSDTVSLLPGSPAIDAADPNGCPATDQRGVVRPVGAGCDIGAYEGVGQSSPSPLVLTFNGAEDSHLPGYLSCESPTTSCPGDPLGDVNLAQKNAMGVVNFYWSHFGRNSLDNAGMPVLSTVYSTYSPNNATWIGNEIVYADGYPKADDVVGHELTHGVVQYEADLFYYYQSGAINESLADTFGEYFHQTNTTDTSWLMGANLPGGAVRSMKDPTLFKDPDKMTSTYYYQGPNDNGGVHWNSGVNNKAVYLMVTGGTFNGKTITPLGWKKTGDIYYYTLTHLLTSGSDYADLYNALYQACTVLNGTDGIGPSDCLQVRSAMDAVQMNSTPKSSYNPDTSATCPSGMTKASSNLFLDNMENGSANWTFGAFQGSPRWSIQSGFAASGDYALYGNDYDSTRAATDQASDSFATMKNGVQVPTGANTYLFFNHAFGFTYAIVSGSNRYLDGAVLEYTTDNGETWKDAKPLFDAGENYTGTLYNETFTGYNPLRNRAGFVGESHGYVSTRYNLSSLAGKTVNFRWRMGTDYEYSFLGWVVDDVTFYQCVANPGVPALSAPSNGSLVSSYQPKLDWGDAAHASSYQLELATDSGFTNLVENPTDLSGSSFQAYTKDLMANTPYYWRVKTTNSIGVQSAWSPTWSFRTPLVTPLLSAPVSGSTPHSLRPIFSWSASSGASSYTLVVSSSSSYSSPLINAILNNSLTSYTPSKDLTTGKKLYARIMANGANPSAWSSINFTTPLPPSVPALVYPANNALLTSITIPGNYKPILSWKASTVPSGAFAFDHYELEVSDKSDFSHMLYPSNPLNPIDLTTTSFPIPDALPDNQAFYWQVRSVNKNGDFSSWAVFSFRTAIVPPVLTAIDSPTLHSLRPGFNWSTPDGATSYTLQVSPNSNLSSPVLNVTVSTLPYTPTVDLPAGKKLYWQVRANGPNGPSLWSNPSSFTSPLPPSVPALVSPSNNTLLTSTSNPPVYTPTLSWKPVTIPSGASAFDHYELQVSDKADFSNLLDTNDTVDATKLMVTSYQIVNPLPDNQSYYWRVRAHNNNNDFSAWAVYSFRTAISTPTQLLPKDDPNTSLNNLRPAFSWNGSSEAASFTIVISAYSSLTSPIVNKTITTPAYTPTSNLPSGKTLYWRVRANGATGPSLWSVTQRFRAK